MPMSRMKVVLYPTGGVSAGAWSTLLVAKPRPPGRSRGNSTVELLLFSLHRAAIDAKPLPQRRPLAAAAATAAAECDSQKESGACIQYRPSARRLRTGGASSAFVKG